MTTPPKSATTVPADWVEVPLPQPSSPLITPSGTTVIATSNPAHPVEMLQRLDQNTINHLLLGGLQEGHAHIRSLGNRVQNLQQQNRNLAKENKRLAVMIDLAKKVSDEKIETEQLKSKFAIGYAATVAFMKWASGPVGLVASVMAGAGVGKGLFFETKSLDENRIISSEERLAFLIAHPEMGEEEASIAFLNEKLKKWAPSLGENAYVPDTERVEEYLAAHPGSTRFDAHLTFVRNLAPPVVYESYDSGSDGSRGGDSAYGDFSPSDSGSANLGGYSGGGLDGYSGGGLDLGSGGYGTY